MTDLVVSAQRRLQREPMPPENDKLFWWGAVNRTTDLAFITEWQSKCHQYKIIRSISKYGADSRFVSMIWSLSKKNFNSRLITRSGDTKSKYPFTDVDFKTLAAAMEAAEKHYMKRKKREVLETNTYKVVKLATTNFLDRLPSPTPIITRVAPKESNGSTPLEGTPKRGGRILLYDYPVTHVIRWMGKDKWSKEDCVKVMKHFNLDVALGTITAQLAAGKKGERGDPAKLSDKQIEELYSITGG